MFECKIVFELVCMVCGMYEGIIIWKNYEFGLRDNKKYSNVDIKICRV